MKTFLIPLACFFAGFVLGGFVSALCSMRSFTEQCEQCINAEAQPDKCNQTANNL